MSINKQILDAISIVAKNYTEHLNFDQTVESEIVDIVDIDEGIYRVLYNGNKLIAKALDKSLNYAIGDAIFLKINESDLSKEKFIVSKREGSSVQNINPIQPIGPILNLIDEKKLYTNQNIEFIAPQEDLFQQFANNYDYLVLSADFTTWFLEDKKGNYGLRIIFDTYDENIKLDNILDSKNFIGKPYEFFEGSTQQILLNYPKGTIKNINSIQFYYENGLELKELNGSQEFINISNLTLQFHDYNDYSENSYNLVINSTKGYEFQNKEENIELVGELLYKGYIKLPKEDIKFQWYQFKNGAWEKLKTNNSIIISEICINLKQYIKIKFLLSKKFIYITKLLKLLQRL